MNGSTIALKHILQELCKRHEIRVVTPITPNMEQSELIKFFTTNNIKYYSLNYGLTVRPAFRKNIILWIIDTYKVFIKTKRARKEIGKILDDFKPNIVHTNNGPVDIAFDNCKKRNIPHIWHLREYSDLGLGLTIFPTTQSWRKKILSNQNYNIAITKGIYNYYNLRECDTVIYDGPINPNIILPEKKQKKYFLFVGSPSQEGKGFYDALLAFTKILNNYPDYNLIAAGPFYSNSPYGVKITNHIKKYNIENHVKFLGYRNDIYKLMTEATALLVTSYFEGFGFTTTEAMFCNCLVIGRNTTGTKEQFDNGLMKTGQEIGYRFETIDELINCMKKAITENTTDIRKQAKLVVKKLYTSTKSNKELENYYQNILMKTQGIN